MDANIEYEVDQVYCIVIRRLQTLMFVIEELLTLHGWAVVHSSGKRETNGESAVKSTMVSYSCKVGKSTIWITLCVMVKIRLVKNDN